jgi:hypothetical protein
VNTEIFARAKKLATADRFEEALEVYRLLLSQAHIVRYEYEEWLKAASACYTALGRSRQVGYIELYLQSFDHAERAFVSVSDDVAVARALELSGRRAVPLEAGGAELQRASDLYTRAGRFVFAAICLSQTSDAQAERRAWERVLVDPRLRGENYEEALAHFNVGVAAGRTGDKEAEHHHLVQAQRLLEDMADEFEMRGERERAFDCYNVLLKMGRDSGSYENLAEGYVNCIRILKEDHLKFYVLQYYEDFLRISLEQEEYYAAAIDFREAADYARRAGLVYDRSYMKRSAETWLLAAEKNERTGGPVEMTENALLSAVDAFASLADLFRVREVYQRLSRLDLGEKKQRRYADIAGHYAGVWQEAVDAPPFPDYLRQSHAYPEIWHADLVSWDLDADYETVCATMVGDVRWADLIRRRALALLLFILDRADEVANVAPHAEAIARKLQPDSDIRYLAEIAKRLGELMVYSALRPLEKLAAHRNSELRRAAVRAARHLYFKRTFQLVERALRDDVTEVRQAALETLSQLTFPHAFDPLTRIFREQEEPLVRETALRSIGGLASLEAGEFLIEVLCNDPEPYRELARDLLAKFDNPDIYPLLKRRSQLEGGRQPRSARPDLQGDGER